MSRNQQDQFIDEDEEETCPLCVEEFDLTDKGFKPCPCGYQICQFCYHNVKTNMNGLCPACRRPYNDKDIEYKPITAEDSAAHKARQAQKQKKTAAALQKEKQRAEADHLSRKHLAGLRVVQKNLVYVTGLSPASQEDQLLQTLRGDQYFGQYGDIVKIVVSKAKDPSHPHSVGVYVTYKRKEDAESCIAAVDGSKNVDRTLRAQYGTTKYCSAYLRGETCQNRSCMFLHEPGEASDSYSRADLSALNAGGSQHGSTRPPPQSQQPVASASPSVAPQLSDQDSSAVPERPALPSHASWASKPMQQPSRTTSRAASVVHESPAIAHATPDTQVEQQPEPPQAPSQEPLAQETPASEPTAPKQTRIRKVRPNDPFFTLLKNFNVDDLRFVFSLSTLSSADHDIVKNYPPLFDKNGGIERRARRQREEEQRRMEQEVQAFQQPPAIEHEENAELSGSLSLGGEPEERQGLGQPGSAVQPPGHDPRGVLDHRFQFGGLSSPVAGERSLNAQQQHQQMLLQSMKPSSGQGATTQTAPYPQQSSNAAGHQRNASRYSFANDTSASTSVKPVASAKLLNQQSAIMPSTGNNHFGGQQQPHGSQFYTSNVQGPPPGLKATGTPPISGGMTFGQGHGFATGGLQYGSGAPGRNANEEMMRNLLRGRDTGSVNSSADPSKHDADFPPLSARLSQTPSRQHSISLDDALSRRSTPPVPPGFEAQIANESRRSTPTIPPGLSRPTALPADLEGSSTSRPGSRASIRRTGSGICPVTPLRPSTPVKRQETPAQSQSEAKDAGAAAAAEVETPTRAPKAAPAKSSKNVQADAADEGSIQGSSKSVTAVETAKRGEVKETAVPAADPAPDAAKETQPVAPVPKQSTVPSDKVVSKEQADVQKVEAQTKPSATSVTSDAVTRDSPRRKHPGKLDISSAVQKADESVSSAQDDTGKTASSVTQTPAAATPSKLDSPSAAASSPAAKAVHRTLRVVSTPKAETPPAVTGPAPPAQAQSAGPSAPSRQASMTVTNPPGTPSSEQVTISDTISVASTSQSRANSPPPAGAGKGKAAAAPRTKTKNQLKKERQERAKAMEEEKSKSEQVESSKAADDAPAQEAIVSRKKKSKKEKEPKPKPKTVAAATADSTPTASRPSTPAAKDTPEPVKETKAAAAPKEAEVTTSRNESPAAKPPSREASREPTPPPTPTLSAAQLLAEIKAQAPEIQKCLDSFFRSPASNYFKSPSPPMDPKDFKTASYWASNPGGGLHKEAIESLLTGKIPAYSYGAGRGAWDHGMFTRTGAHITALDEELEMRFLELEHALLELPEELRFRPTKPQNDTRFPGVDLVALKRHLENAGGRGVSVMEQMIQDGGAMKKGAFLVDEATKYLNEFIMPPATPPPPPPATGGNAAGAGSGPTPAYPQANTTASNHPTPSVGMNSISYNPMNVAGVDPVVAERALHDSRRVAEERDTALRKIMKKNRKVLGLG